MKGAWRLAIVVWAAGLSLGAVPAAAQEVPPPAAAPAPAPGTVGPRELQDFSLQGNVTRPAAQPAQQPAARPTVTPRQTTNAAAPIRERDRQAAAASPQPAVPVSRGAPRPAQVSADFERPLPPATSAPAVPATTPAQPEPTFAPAPESAATFAPSHHLLIWPWLLAAAVLAGAMLFLFLRRRGHRAAAAGGPQMDLFAAPEPAPAPPRAADPAPRTAGPRGVVSSSLRPWIEVRVHPLRCILTEQDVTIEFELELLNSGNAPARAIHVAAAMINAGDRQDQELAEFFQALPGPGERIDVIPPLKTMIITTQIAGANDHLRARDVGGRQVFVPLLVFNVRYGFCGKEGQTAVAYMIGRDGKGDKLAPFRLDLGPRLFRGLGARLLPTGIRS